MKVKEENISSEFFCPRLKGEDAFWPSTEAGKVATISCTRRYDNLLFNYTGEATKECHKDGQWAISNYANCTKTTTTYHSTADSAVTSDVYFYGKIVSLISVAFAIAILCSFRKLRQRKRTQIHIQTLFSYSFADMSWLLNTLRGVPTSESSSPTLTFSLNFLTFYSVAANYYWMLNEGIYILSMCFNSLTADFRPIYKYVVIGWVVPLLMTSFWAYWKFLWIDFDNLSGMDALLAQYCFLHLRTSVDMFYIFACLLPIAINALIMIYVYITINFLQKRQGSEVKWFKNLCKILLSLSPILGINYILTLHGPFDGLFGSIFEYIRAAIQALQGFIIAISYCVLNVEVRSTLLYHTLKRITLVTNRLRDGRGPAPHIV